VRDGVECLRDVHNGHHAPGVRLHAEQGFSEEADVDLAAVLCGESRLHPGQSDVSSYPSVDDADEWASQYRPDSYRFSVVDVGHILP